MLGRALSLICVCVRVCVRGLPDRLRGEQTSEPVDEPSIKQLLSEYGNRRVVSTLRALPVGLLGELSNLSEKGEEGGQAERRQIRHSQMQIEMGVPGKRAGCALE